MHTSNPNRIRAGQLVVVTPARPSACTELEYAFAAMARDANGGQGVPEAAAPEVVNRFYDLLNIVDGQAAGAVGAYATAYSYRVRRVGEILREIEELYVRTYNQHGRLHLQSFFQQRRALLERLDQALGQMVRSRLIDPRHINRNSTGTTNASAAGLRELAKRSRDPRQIRRLLALAAVYAGMSRADAAQFGGMDRQTLRDWAHRFNAKGLEGLRDRPGAGRPRQLTEAQMEELAEIVETGPDPATDGIIRWRRVDLKRVIEARFGVVYSERSISDLLAKLSFSYISGRPQHPRQDQRVLEGFKKLPAHARSPHRPSARGQAD